MEDLASNRILTDQELKIRNSLQQELWNVSNAVESLLRQKSRISWLKEGDCNSGYFHRIINFRRAFNAIPGISIDGVWVQQPNTVKNAAVNYFQTRFSEQDYSRPFLDGVPFKAISQRQREQMTAPFSDLELKEAVWNCGGDKCPGPDGLNFNFIKKFWDIMRPEFRRFVDEFYAHGSFPRGSNASFVALIPKLNHPQSFNDYRPISLIGCMYKVIAKLLSNRLRSVMDGLIDERQSAFIKGRHILHGIVILNEVVEEARRSKKPVMIFKVDFEKAYDSVSWSFLDYMLFRLGFCPKWRSWISACLHSASICVLINGSPSKEFTPTRGLRQGDPLAPLLFNIVGEGITGMMRQAVHKNLFRSFLVGKNREPINILQYADDTVFVGEAVWDNIHAIKAILRGFELASGLKINFAKSQFGVIGDGVNWAREAANNLNCRQLECPFLYLGIPIGANPSSQLVWEPIITKFKSKLAKWAQKNISMAGKVTLINSVLNALPIYLLSFFKIPQKVVKKLISLQRNFLWGGDIDQKKIPWVKWTDLCLPKADGGLGIKDISKFNSALMGRWLWAFASDQQQLWARVITSKYGGWSDLQNARDKRGYSHWWRDIRNLYHQLDCSIFKDNLSWKVGCGENIKFWTDNWLGEQYSLQQKYYQLFLISRQQRDLISQEEENFLCTLVDSKKNLMPNRKDLIQSEQRGT